MVDIVAKKKELRNILIKKRENIKKNSKVNFNIKFFNKLKLKINFDTIYNVASFNSIRSEISTTKLNEQIINSNKTLSFPIVQNNHEELKFRKVSAKDKFKIGKFNIPEPTNDSDEVIPELFFVPCLGFDSNGYRIGYGGGFYDRTFAKYKKLNIKFYTVGFAFDEQKENNIPKEEFDYKLDFVLTEKQLYDFV
mgnify:CR=1 FL=1